MSTPPYSGQNEKDAGPQQERFAWAEEQKPAVNVDKPQVNIDEPQVRLLPLQRGRGRTGREDRRPAWRLAPAGPATVDAGSSVADGPGASRLAGRATGRARDDGENLPGAGAGPEGSASAAGSGPEVRFGRGTGRLGGGGSGRLPTW